MGGTISDKPSSPEKPMKEDKVGDVINDEDGSKKLTIEPVMNNITPVEELSEREDLSQKGSE